MMIFSLSPLIFRSCNNGDKLVLLLNSFSPENISKSVLETIHSLLRWCMFTHFTLITHLGNNSIIMSVKGKEGATDRYRCKRYDHQTCLSNDVRVRRRERETTGKQTEKKREEGEKRIWWETGKQESMSPVSWHFEESQGKSCLEDSFIEIQKSWLQTGNHSRE